MYINVLASKVIPSTMSSPSLSKGSYPASYRPCLSTLRNGPSSKAIKSLHSWGSSWTALPPLAVTHLSFISRRPRKLSRVQSMYGPMTAFAPGETSCHRSARPVVPLDPGERRSLEGGVVKPRTSHSGARGQQWRAIIVAS
jgi:hypothetical protein